MDALVLSTLLFNAVGIVAIVIGMALAYCLPNHKQLRSWVATEAGTAVRPAAQHAELPHAA